jgi:predicted ATPase
VIRELHLQGFKRFQDERLPLAKLTVLTGFNSGGKSSTMQGLLLLHRAAADKASGSAGNLVALNAPGLTLGDFGTVINETLGGDAFTLGVKTESSDVGWTFGKPDRSADSFAVRVQDVTLNGAPHPGETSFAPSWLHENPDADALLKALARLRFVPADRLGPAETYPLDDLARHETPGPRAERTFGNLFLWEDQIPEKLCRPSESARTLVRQAEAWLSELVSTGAKVVLQPLRVKNANLVTLGIQTNEKLSFHRPHNVGFGVTYVLSVILAVLTAQKDDVVMIENPEAHLHPRAQSRLAQFLFVQAAIAGIQIVLETHSDHVLNGIRVAVHAAEIAPEDVSILFFDGASTEPGKVAKRIGVTKHGRIDDWPEGFFDETEKLLGALLRKPGSVK